MKKLIVSAIALTFILVLGSCGEEDIEPYALTIPKTCFPTAHELSYDEGDANATTFLNSNPKIWIPNCFTPNGDGTNDEFKLYVTSGDAQVKWRNMKIYDKDKNIITRLGDQNGWDGKLADGTIANATYGFQIEIWMINEDITLQAYGAMCVRTCFESDDDTKSAVFYDQLHPSQGVIYETLEIFETCE
ncbi:MAG: T9SS type B sorting domain-containing protein [Bacteroidia bacterium]